MENIWRVNSRIFRSRDANGDEFFRPKPYYQIENRELVLHNVPVPKQPWTKQTVPADYLPYVYPPFFQQAWGEKKAGKDVRLFSSKLGVELRQMIKSVRMRFKRFRLLQQYNAPDNPKWLLLRQILETWFSASRTPVLLVLIPHYSLLMESSNPNVCQARFRELAKDTGCRLYDPLPDLLKLTADEQRTLYFSDEHLSARGHEAMASLLTPIFESFVRDS